MLVGVSEDSVRRAADAGLRLTDLAVYEATPSGGSTLVIGYGNLADNAVLPAVTLLAALLRR